MAEINETIKKKLKAYPKPIEELCVEIIAFAQNMPVTAVKEHLDTLIRKIVKKEELGS